MSQFLGVIYYITTPGAGSSKLDLCTVVFNVSEVFFGTYYMGLSKSSFKGKRIRMGWSFNYQKVPTSPYA